MGFTKSDVDFAPAPVTEIQDAKKKGKKSGAMAKGKAGGPADMRAVPPKDMSVDASKNAAKKVSIKKQKLS